MSGTKINHVKQMSNCEKPCPDPNISSLVKHGRGSIIQPGLAWLFLNQAHNSFLVIMEAEE